MSRAGATLAAVLLVSLLPAGCQNADNPSRPPVVVITPEPVHGIIAHANFSDFHSDLWVAVQVQISTAGVADITVDWTFPDSWLYVYFGDTNCDYQQLTKHTCPFLISSETQLPKPRVLVTNLLKPGTYYVMLYNVPKDTRRGIGSDNTEAVQVRIGLTIPPSSSRPEVAPLSLGPAKVVSRQTP